ncbi:patatin-like phospholipase family protein [Nonomuraea angiospora]|uniref:patatin-like phospholipase family protein n=1 Tax=Nonomuraea angiospora TaxID=46172 RepID=UPI00344C22D1
MTSRAVVLGSGGVAGIAWEAGVLAALATRGLDLREADLIVGTSAGAVVGAQLAAGLDPRDLYSERLVPQEGDPAPKTSVFGLFRLVRELLKAKDSREFGARMGRLALAAATPPEERRRAEVQRWLGDLHEWPDKPLIITAVDAESGEPANFAADSGVTLLDAVCASTAGPGVRPPATVGGRRYIDGGMRSPANLDLASGYDRIVVIAPVVRGGGVMPSVQKQIDALGSRSRVALVSPDPKTWRAITGRGGLLDPARAPLAAEAGRSLNVAEDVATVWTL